MPTIELVSIGCAKIPDLPKYPSFAYIAEKELISHRSLFQNVFDSLTGVVVHLANKSFEDDEGGAWFAGAIMDWDDDKALVFLPETRRDIEDLMKRLIFASPERRITFSTDYQFGGRRKKCETLTLHEFLRLHDKLLLRYNKLWHIHSEGLNESGKAVHSTAARA